MNIHFHILFLDGIYVYRGNRPPRFQRVKALDKGDLQELVQLTSQRVGRCLERQGLPEQDTESAWLYFDPGEDADAMPQILSSSISYRVAVGPQQGPKTFMIRTIRPLDRPDPILERVARANGFSLHARVSCEGDQKGKRERLCPYISRPAVAGATDQGATWKVVTFRWEGFQTRSTVPSGMRITGPSNRMRQSGSWSEG